MPELPELEVVCEVLQRRVVGKVITDVQLIPPGGPIFERDLAGTGFEPSLKDATISAIGRRGKFLIFVMQAASGPFYMAINPKLTGRLQLADPGDKRFARTHLVLTLADGRQLRYVDHKKMGQLYLTRDLSAVPDYDDLGPEPFAISRESFHEGLKPFKGEIKGVLTRGQFIAGIGNAYADEILWAARLHPYRKRTQLTADEIDRLYDGMRSTLARAAARPFH
jgi:formamidopyrimidine-DNA glycosylase